MTLIDSQKAVLKSLANELNDGYFEIYSRLQSGLILRESAKEIATKVAELESMMSYIRFEASRINASIVGSVASEVSNIWQEEK